MLCPQYGIDLPQFGAADMNVPTFRTLTTYSWEQSDMLVKIYVPLRGVQTDLLRHDSLYLEECVRVMVSLPWGMCQGHNKEGPGRLSNFPRVKVCCLPVCVQQHTRSWFNCAPLCPDISSAPILLRCRATFMHMGLEVKVIGLQGRSYVFVIKTLYKPINADACHVAASKTKKNILITLQARNLTSPPGSHASCLTASRTVQAKRMPRICRSASWSCFAWLCPDRRRLTRGNGFVTPARSLTRDVPRAQKLHWDTADEKHWKDLSLPGT